MDRYWIAINGATCAIAPIPMRRPEVIPRPWQLIGFPSIEQAREAQRICLEESIPVVRKFMAGLVPEVDAGQIVIIQHDDPEPPVPGGTTAWLDAPLPKNAN